MCLRLHLKELNSYIFVVIGAHHEFAIWPLGSNDVFTKLLNKVNKRKEDQNEKERGDDKSELELRISLTCL